jgi:hypothetical protein
MELLALFVDRLASDRKLGRTTTYMFGRTRKRRLTWREFERAPMQGRLFRFPNRADRPPQPYARATAVFVDEFDSLTGQYVHDQRERS